MRKTIAIFLLSVFLFSALVPVQAQEELTKLPSLLEHFQEHKIETPGLTFLEFLKIHYGEEFAQHRSAHDHSDLPGKNSCHHLHAPAIAVLPAVAFAAPNLQVSVAVQPLFADQSYEFTLFHDIWQPPRAV